MGPVFTMLALRDCPLHLAFFELGRETVFHSDLATLVLYTLVETSLVARISVVRLSPKPKPQRQGSIALQLFILFIVCLLCVLEVIPNLRSLIKRKHEIMQRKLIKP